MLGASEFNPAKQGLVELALDKEHFSFSAAHFISFANNECENLHGHNYHVGIRLLGQLNHAGYLLDFSALKDKLRWVIKKLNHKVILQTRSSIIKLELSDTSVMVEHSAKKYLFPREDVYLLEANNSSAENIAAHIGKIFIYEGLVEEERAVLSRFSCSVWETEKQNATFFWDEF